MAVVVCLTVDTEHSMGGAWADRNLRPVSTERRIYCKIKGVDNGIGWICNQLKLHGLRATFFCEVFNALVFGMDDAKGWIEFLIEQGQDVQLHTHLNYYYYAHEQLQNMPNPSRTDDLAALPPSLRRCILGQAIELFSNLSGKFPTAYRAGNWQASRSLIADLANAGIRLDSSFNPAAKGSGSFDREDLQPNTLQIVEGVRELPLTVARQSLPGRSVLKPLDLVSLSRWEIRKVLDDAEMLGLTHVTFVLHSFSTVKAADVQYERMRRNRIVQRRTTFLIEYLAQNKERFRVATCTDIANEPDSILLKSQPVIPSLGFLRPFARTLTQAANSMFWV